VFAVRTPHHNYWSMKLKIARGDIVRLKDGREGAVLSLETRGVVEVRAGGLVYSHIDCLELIVSTTEHKRSSAITEAVEQPTLCDGQVRLSGSILGSDRQMCNAAELASYLRCACSDWCRRCTYPNIPLDDRNCLYPNSAP
jgi:hypothetical protein